MASWKILVADEIDSNGLAVLSQAAEVENAPEISPERLLRIIGDYNALIVGRRTRVTAEVLEASRQLQVVGRAGVGVENIDLSAAHQRGITVVHTPTAVTVAMTEHTLALMLALARWIPPADRGMKTGQWPAVAQRGVELYGKTLGLIGVGRIGSAVAHRAAALGMHLVGCDHYLNPEELRRRGAEPTSLPELFAQSDFISLHVPLNPETRGLINGQALCQMKRGVRIICTGRGGLLDETALLGALESGQVAGVALDVSSQVPPGMNALINHPHVIATPHSGPETVEASQRAAADVAQEVLAVLRNEPVRWRVV